MKLSSWCVTSATILPDIWLLQVAVVFLVVLDAFFVLAELLIDLSVIKLEHNHILPEVRPRPSSSSSCLSFSFSLWLTNALLAFFFADFSLLQLGSSDLFHGGAHGETLRLSLGLLRAQIWGVWWFDRGDFFCAGHCLHLPWGRLRRLRPPDPAASLEGGQNHQWLVTMLLKGTIWPWFKGWIRLPLACSYCRCCCNTLWWVQKKEPGLSDVTTSLNGTTNTSRSHPAGVSSVQRPLQFHCDQLICSSAREWLSVLGLQESWCQWRPEHSRSCTSWRRATITWCRESRSCRSESINWLVD